MVGGAAPSAVGYPGRASPSTVGVWPMSRFRRGHRPTSSAASSRSSRSPSRSSPRSPIRPRRPTSSSPPSRSWPSRCGRTRPACLCRRSRSPSWFQSSSPSARGSSSHCCSTSRSSGSSSGAGHDRCSTAIALGLLATASPVVGSVIQDPSELAVGIWILGIVFPWVIGRTLARQDELADQLDRTRLELADQALLDERRRIARDVHDFVGHGLAAVMLQVTSARHVLRRDPDAAEDALRSAEEVGRRSMQELRRTVALLRSDDEAGVAPPVPSATEISDLVDDARAGGLRVELTTRGELDRVPPGSRRRALPDRPGSACECGPPRAARPNRARARAARRARGVHGRDDRPRGRCGRRRARPVPVRAHRDARACELRSAAS